VTLFVAGLGLGFFALLGAVWDGGQVRAAGTRALAEADGAARAAAQAISVDALRTDDRVVLDPGAAEAAALSFLSVFGHDQGVTVTVTGDRVVVTVQIAQPLDILVPLGPVTVTGRGEARARVGVTEAER
jgi:hypothetical protein